MGRFADLCIKHGCDKESVHRYGDAYDILLRPFKELHPLKILEIGIYKGASLTVFREYFPQAKIWAIDIDLEPAIGKIPKSVEAIRGDQSDADFLNRLATTYGNFDIIIDDGSHRVDHQRISFGALWPFVSVGGIYVIEDLESSISPRPKRNNPQGLETTLDMLLNMAKSHVHWRHCDKKPPMLSFFRELCCITKLE